MNTIFRNLGRSKIITEERKAPREVGRRWQKHTSYVWEPGSREDCSSTETIDTETDCEKAGRDE